LAESVEHRNTFEDAKKAHAGGVGGDDEVKISIEYARRWP
jgi:hypothetical protein